MPSIKFNLRNTQSVGPTPINCVVRWSGNRLVYPTGEKVSPEHWNAKNQRARRSNSFPQGPDLNALLDALSLQVDLSFRQFKLTYGRDPELSELRNELNGALKRIDGSANDLLSFIDQLIDGTAGSFNSTRNRPLHKSTVSKYKVTREHLNNYVLATRKGSTRMSFAEIDVDFMNGFTRYLTEIKGYSVNTVVKYGKTLRQFLKAAQEDGHEINPLIFGRRVQLKEEPSDQIYLTKTELADLFALNLEKTPYLERARDLFIVGAWTGLRFGDLSKILPEHIQGDLLRVPTSKTGKVVQIPLHPYVQTILDKYKGRFPSGISNQKQNKYLKQVASRVPSLQQKVIIGKTVAGLRVEVAKHKWEMVTTHTARRSFASNLFKDGIAARSIMAVTGHTTEQSFYRYIRLDNSEHAKIIADSPLFRSPSLKVV